MKIRMKTSSAGKQQANIIQMGNLPSEPRGLMSQPRLLGLVTEKPLGTLSFCTENDRAGEDDSEDEGQTCARWGSESLYLNEGVAEVVSHQDHDEDCNRNAKISNNPPQLTHTHRTHKQVCSYCPGLTMTLIWRLMFSCSPFQERMRCF